MAMVTGGLWSLVQLADLDDRVRATCSPFFAIGAAGPMVMTAIPTRRPPGTGGGLLRQRGREHLQLRA